MPRVLIVAGSDSSGGAGIQADLKTCAALGVHGMTAVTSVTAQNTCKVTAISDIPAEIIREQIRVVAEDIGVDAVKTGMLHTSSIIEAVADEISRLNVPIIVDPVAIAKSGARLIREEAVQTLMQRMVPIAWVITPNALEAEMLTGIGIVGVETQKKAAKAIVEMGARSAVVKGGHLPSRNVIDVLYYAGRFFYYDSKRIDTRATHGTGCVFASAIAASIAKGLDVDEAVDVAKRFVTDAIKYGLNLGAGQGPVHPTGRLSREAERWGVLGNMREALELLEADPYIHNLVPESQINLAMSLTNPTEIGDVAAVPGRIVKVGERVKAVETPSFGSSRHVARAIIAASKHNPRVTAAANIKNAPVILRAAAELGYTASMYDRSKEPAEVKAEEGRTVSWGVGEAIKMRGYVPDLIYHHGDYGKEPMALVFGRDAVDVARKLMRIAERAASIAEG